MKNILIYGGTFDPPHNGHLNTALAVQNRLHFNRFVFLPCKTPVLKKASLASGKERVAMLKLALEDYLAFEIDLREMTRDTPSFMVDTLASYRQELGHHAKITLCLGTDAFMQLPQWHSWQKILELSHLLVIKRPERKEQCMPDVIKKLLLTHETFDPDTLLTSPCGKIYRFDAGEYPISSTWLRSQIQAGHKVDKFLPAKVYQYIKTMGIYKHS